MAVYNHVFYTIKMIYITLIEVKFGPLQKGCRIKHMWILHTLNKVLTILGTKNIYLRFKALNKGL